MSNENFDTEFDKLFDSELPKVDQTTKKATIDQALENFSQGFKESPRLIDNRENWFSTTILSIKRFFMNTTHKPAISNSFATVAIAFIAVSVALLIPNLEGDLSKPVGDPSNSYDQTLSKTPSNSGNRELATIVVNKELKAPNTVSVQDTKSETFVAADAVSTGPTSLSKPKELEEASVSAYQAERPEVAVIPKQKFAAQSNTKSRQRLLGLGTPAPSSPIKREDYARQQAARPDADEEYAQYEVNSIVQTADQPVSTFSIDVDTASYSLIRNQLNQGFLPKPQAVRAEELINYFDYDYPLPQSSKLPFAPSISVLDSPWNDNKKLVHIGIKGYDIAPSEVPDSNLVFLLDVSGSMSSANKLPLVKQSINLLLDILKPTDTISIVVYAGAAGTVLEPTEVRDRNKITDALQRLDAGGSTAGGAGIELAYDLAEQNYSKDAVNRIILATDGDFNVGQSSNQDLQTLVERKRDKGVLLSILGFGRNNYQDDMMQTLAQNGNGVAAYIDSLSEAKKVLVDEATSTLFTIAKDVKIQIEFNPSVVSDYRLIGYETRALKREDFNNDKVDAGDIGAGHTVTAIYEVTPSDAKHQSIDPARYEQNKPKIVERLGEKESDEIGFLKIRYKTPNSDKSDLISMPIENENTKINSDTQFSVAVAGFAQLLANSKYSGDLSYDDVIDLASKHKGEDNFGYRSEFIQLARMAKIAKP